MPGSGRLGILKGSTSDDFVWNFAYQRDAVSQFAPHKLSRETVANYVPVPVALSDHMPEEWKGNSAVQIPIEFEIVGDKQRDVNTALRKLRKFIRKDRKTGEPPDLIFVLGNRSWKCRLHRMHEEVVMWNQDANEQRVRVQLTLHTIEWEQ